MKGAIKGVIALVLVAMIVSAGGAFAARNESRARPGGSGGGSVSLRLLDATDTQANIGDRATFNVSSSYTYVWVTAKCVQNGTTVYTETRGFYPEYPWGTTYTLGPTSVWTSGSASCTGTLFTTSNNKTIVLATTTFTVSG